METVYRAGGIVVLLLILGWMADRDAREQSLQSHAAQCPPPLSQYAFVGSGHDETHGARVLRCIYIASQ